MRLHVIASVPCLYRDDSFRPEFSRIGDIRSIKPSDVRIMALTATATNTTRKVVISRLCMEDPVIVYVPPTKTNITYSVIEKPSINVVVQQIAKELLEYGDKSCRTIIYCRKHLEVASMYEEFVKVLGESFTFPIGKPYLVMYRLVDMYTKCTDNCIKEKIVSAFANPDSTLRVIIATTAFGMGIDCPNVHNVLHWGPAEDIESYVQQTGRAGRDDKQSRATLYFSLNDRKHTHSDMMSYCTNVLLCRRKLLFADFCDVGLFNPSVTGCTCCDICSRCCKCDNCACK